MDMGYSSMLNRMGHVSIHVRETMWIEREDQINKRYLAQYRRDIFPYKKLFSTN